LRRLPFPLGPSRPSCHCSAPAHTKGGRLAMGNHGIISTYRDGCRCEDCDTYARAYERERGRRRRVGAPTTNLVDATPVRQHLRQLMRAGMSYRDINAMLGINIHYLL